MKQETKLVDTHILETKTGYVLLKTFDLTKLWSIFILDICNSEY